MRGSKEARAWEGTYAAIKTAVHAYAREPTDANAKLVRATMLRKRMLDDGDARRSSPLSARPRHLSRATSR